MTILMNANREWEKRADDEKFSSIADLHAAALATRQASGRATLARSSVKAIATEGGSIALSGRSGATAGLTNWSFGQLASIANAPADYLRRLPAKLAADCINSGIGKRSEMTGDAKLSLLFNRGEALQVRAMLSEQYDRIWNSDITSRLAELEAQGPWQPAPAAFDGSRGLYMGDRDMFAFMVDNNRRIFETAPGGGLARGFFVWNSEVGARSFGIMTFFYEFVCGNHRVWGASDIKELRIRHVGDASGKAFGELEGALVEYAESSALEDEAKIKSAMRFSLGSNKEAVLDAIFRLRVPNLGKRLVESAYALAEQRVDWYGSPHTAWGMGGALTEIARDLPNADARVALEASAAKVMELAL